MGVGDGVGAVLKFQSRVRRGAYKGRFGCGVYHGNGQQARHDMTLACYAGQA